jgi:hypothetical protein
MSVRRRVRRGPLAEWPGSVILLGVATGVFRRSNAGAGGSTVVCVLLESDSPLVKELWLPLRLAAGRDFWRGTTLATIVQFAMVCFGLFSHVVVV